MDVGGDKHTLSKHTHTQPMTGRIGVAIACGEYGVLRREKNTELYYFIHSSLIIFFLTQNCVSKIDK